ncbi:MAG: HAD-IB family hydrolase [Thermodesulfobacteriota bacterium]
MPSSKPAAFFDFDKTLLTTNSAKLGMWYLYKRGMLPASFAAFAGMFNLFYKRHIISEERMARILILYYRGKRLSDFEEGAEYFYHHYLKPKLSPGMLSRLSWHHKRGHVCVLISGSIRYYLTAVARDLGFHHLLCTDLEVGPDGLLTGRPSVLCVDATKASLAADLARTQNLDLGASYAYGNHQSDIPLLEMVGHPFAVAPTHPLLKTAAQRGWPVLGF